MSVRTAEAAPQTTHRYQLESGLGRLTPAQRAASANVKPAGPFWAISSSAARISASLRFPW